MDLSEAIKIVEAAGYKVSKPRAPRHHNRGIQETNPFGHAYPHAKLRNVTLTSITRLSKFAPGCSLPMVPNNDIRNYSISGKVPT